MTKTTTVPTGKSTKLPTDNPTKKSQTAATENRKKELRNRNREKQKRELMRLESEGVILEGGLQCDLRHVNWS